MPFIAKHFREPNLKFCFGLKRYVSGPVLLPARKKFFKKIKNSVFRFSGQLLNEGFRHHALAICKGVPRKEKGHVEGYAMFESVRDHKEYVFVPDGKVKKRAILGKYAIMGSMDYEVVGSQYGCSLIDITFTKFNRHLPRLMLLELLSPILGDSLYMQRVAYVDGVPLLIRPKDIYRTKRLEGDLTMLSDRLSLSSQEIYTKLPIYWHVYRTVFPVDNVPDGSKESLDLVASAPLPPHMDAMLKCLSLYDVAIRHLQRVDEEMKQEFEWNVI